MSGGPPIGRLQAWYPETGNRVTIGAVWGTDLDFLIGNLQLAMESNEYQEAAKPVLKDALEGKCRLSIVKNTPREEDDF